MLVTLVWKDCSCVWKRPALKNQSAFFTIGPPIVYSCVGTTLSSLVSLNGVTVRQLSLLTPSRYEPLNWLPPDLVIAFTRPPPKRPYSAEIPDVETVVSWIASSMNRLTGCPRRFSVMATPFSMNTLSYAIAPAIVNDPSPPVVPPGPVGLTFGAEATAACSVLVLGRVDRSDCLTVLPLCTVFRKLRCWSPTTVTFSVTPPMPSDASSGTVSV